jgi:TonB-linked SusC/RagA family outer membrane protein
MKRNLLFLKAHTLLAALLTLAAFLPPAAAEGRAQNPNARLDFTFQDTEVRRILEEVEKQSDYYFAYNHEQVDVARRVSIRVENETIQRVLQMLFEGTEMKYEIRGRQIALSPATHLTPGAPAETAPATSREVMRDGSQAVADSGPTGQRAVTGRVLDANGAPIPGASVVTPDLAAGVATDATGRFVIYVPGGTRTLNISMVGFEDVRQAIPASGNMVVTMKDGLQVISEVIVTGYQTLSPERSTGSATTLPQEFINERMDGNILDKMEGVIPGLYRHQGAYNIRGISTIFGEQKPLYVIDGYPVDTEYTVDGSMAGKSPLASLNPRDIANVTVLKDAAAASIYGVRGANGVIVITTHSGRSGKTRINANSSFTIEPIADYSKLDQMSSRELVDYQRELFSMGMDSYALDDRLKRPTVFETMYNHYKRDGSDPRYITESQMNSILDRLRNSDNMRQVKDNLMQSALTQEHAISAGGGTQAHRYYLSFDYKGLRQKAKGSKENYVNILFKESADLARWLTVDGAVALRMEDSHSDGNNYGNYVGHYGMPYDMLLDENGEPTKMYRLKSQSEVERLIGEGLEDESSNPITERRMVDNTSRGTYLRLQGGLTIKPLEGLTMNLSYQTERNYLHKRGAVHENSYLAKNIRNDATRITLVPRWDLVEETVTIDPVTGEKTTIKVERPTDIIDRVVERFIPMGGIMSDSRESMRNYTFRAQVDFNRTFGDRHQVTALAGAERRSELYGFTQFYKLAYDHSRNLYELIDVAALARGIQGTQAVNGEYRYNDMDKNKLYDKENRYVSFYGNAGYTFDNRYTATVSARVDDTNLFGSNPEYRYLPMWSAGLKWIAGRENFMSEVSWVDNLALRLTYGITGNVMHGTGPFLIMQTALNPTTGQMGSEVISPPNESLRWEKTAVFNLGVDMSVLDNRLHATLEYYSRNTSDLLAEPEIDPTNFASGYAQSRMMQNFGNLYNRGFELSLRALAVKAGDFSWQSSLNYSHNKNKITRGNGVDNSLASLTNNAGLLVEGRPRDAIFRFRYAGLSPDDGSILVYRYLKGDPDAADPDERVDRWDSEPVASLGANDIASLVYSGTLRPKWTAGFINTFRWRSLSLAVHVVANGGHVMLDPMPGVLNNSSAFGDLNPDRRAANFWRRPGDEQKSGIMPAPRFGPVSSDYNMMWYAADRHVMPADYIKVRNINLNYEMPRRWFGHSVFESARVMLQVRNPFVVWTRNREHIDPEALNYSPAGLPMRAIITPQYIVGLDFTF